MLKSVPLTIPLFQSQGRSQHAEWVLKRTIPLALEIWKSVFEEMTPVWYPHSEVESRSSKGNGEGHSRLRRWLRARHHGTNPPTTFQQMHAFGISKI
jgi:hypothetical protein